MGFGEVHDTCPEFPQITLLSHSSVRALGAFSPPDAVPLSKLQWHHIPGILGCCKIREVCAAGTWSVIPVPLCQCPQLLHILQLGLERRLGLEQSLGLEQRLGLTTHLPLKSSPAEKEPGAQDPGSLPCSVLEWVVADVCNTPRYHFAL